MSNLHTIEKVGGTSMSRFKELMDTIFLGNLKDNNVYNRIFVVSAYSGMTNMLLEHKKTGEPGVYASFAACDGKWKKLLEDVRKKMLEINKSLESLGLDIKKANSFVNERVDGIKSCLQDLLRLHSYGHLSAENYLPASREFLSALGEAHSAYNSSLILQANGVNATFVDLTGWKRNNNLSNQ